MQSLSYLCKIYPGIVSFGKKYKNLDIFMVYDNDLIHFLLRLLPDC